MAAITRSTSQMAKLFDCTGRYIVTLENDGVIKKIARGKYELEPTVTAYIRFLRDRTSNETHSEDIDFHKEKARDTKLQADLREMELAEKRSELIPLEVVTEEVLEVSSIFASNLEAISGRLANDLARCADPAQVHTILFDELRRIRIATAERLQRYASDLQDTADCIKDSQRAVTEDSGRVGGSQ